MKGCQKQKNRTVGGLVLMAIPPMLLCWVAVAGLDNIIFPESAWNLLKWLSILSGVAALLAVGLAIARRPRRWHANAALAVEIAMQLMAWLLVTAAWYWPSTSALMDGILNRIAEGIFVLGAIWMPPAIVITAAISLCSSRNEWFVAALAEFAGLLTGLYLFGMLVCGYGG